MKSIVVLSGKGGVGKSSITASLAVAFSKNNKIICADCDVDASNLALLFGLTDDKYEKWVPLSTNHIAIVDEKKCNHCGKCVKACYFNALKISETNQKKVPTVNQFGCEGCGACELICPVGAIELKKIDNAYIGYAKTKYDFLIASAQLSPGNSGSGKVVSEVREIIKELSEEINPEFVIIDSAAGIGCPVIASVTGNDYAVVVTEPTPSGFADMKKALDIVDHFRIKSGIVINKFDLNDDYTLKIEEFAKRKNINILKKIPFDMAFVKAMVSTMPLVGSSIDSEGKYKIMFESIKEKILDEMNNQ